MTRALKIAGQIWLFLAFAVIVIGYASIWWLQGFWALADIMSPFNVANWSVVLLTVAPGLLMLWWAEKRARQGR